MITFCEFSSVVFVLMNVRELSSELAQSLGGAMTTRITCLVR